MTVSRERPSFGARSASATWCPAISRSGAQAVPQVDVVLDHAPRGARLPTGRKRRGPARPWRAAGLAGRPCRPPLWILGREAVRGVVVEHEVPEHAALVGHGGEARTPDPLRGDVDERNSTACYLASYGPQHLGLGP